MCNVAVLAARRMLRPFHFEGSLTHQLRSFKAMCESRTLELQLRLVAKAS